MAYRNYCVANGLDRIRQASFPWTSIVSSRKSFFTCSFPIHLNSIKPCPLTFLHKLPIWLFLELVLFVGYETKTQVSSPQHKCINPRDWSFTLPVTPHAPPPPTDTPPLGGGADLFTYLANIRESSPPTAIILATFDEKTATGESLDLRPLLLLYTAGDLGREVAPFVQVLNDATTADAAIMVNNRDPLLETVLNHQEPFVQAIHAQLWIRSPALQGTLRRGIKRYINFVKLLKLYPNEKNKNLFVPTLDIDLVWRTHLCSPEQYQASIIQRAGRFIAPDDDAFDTQRAEDGGGGAGDMEATKKLFRLRIGQEYSICLCWDCEAAMSAVEAAAGKDDHGTEMDHVAEGILEDVAYYRAVELARRARKALPVR